MDACVTKVIAEADMVDMAALRLSLIEVGEFIAVGGSSPIFVVTRVLLFSAITLPATGGSRCCCCCFFFFCGLLL